MVEQLNSAVSRMAEGLKGSEIIKLANQINARIREGEKIYNLTIGDFNPNIFNVPAVFKKHLFEAYDNNHTNYPQANGILELRESLSKYIEKYYQLKFDKEDILVAGGGRPLIYASYRAIINPEEKVLFPVPSWNNNHYSFLTDSSCIEIPTKAENNFMPTADELKEHLPKVHLLALCSPLNPTGTIFRKEDLLEICNLVLEENKRRAGEKPLYILYDQIYSQLLFGDKKHYHPQQLVPEVGKYVITIDGLSKAFAATGVRVGWATGPKEVIDKMKSILGHIGAWSPKPEQMATSMFFNDEKAVENFLEEIKIKLEERLMGIYLLFQNLKNKGFDVDAIYPEAAMYVTVNLNLKGKITPDGNVIENSEDVANFLLNEAKVAIVPFYAFGTDKNKFWFRVSVGTCQMNDLPIIESQIEKALSKLK